MIYNITNQIIRISVLCIVFILGFCGQSLTVIASPLVEQVIADKLSSYGLDEDFTLFVKTFNGGEFVYNRGDSSVDTIYKSASTSKLVTAATVLTLVDKGVLSLEDNPQDYIGFWPKYGKLSQVTLANLLSFTSGLSQEPACIHNPFSSTRACVKKILEANKRYASTPGAEYIYSSTHLQVAGLMAINASRVNTWHDVFSGMQNEHDIFLSSSYGLPSEKNPRLAGGMYWSAQDYIGFLDKLVNHELFNSTLFKALSSDQLGETTIVKSPIMEKLGEDWHYGFGVWLECNANPYDCEGVERISSPGAYGAYPFIDFQHGYYGIVAMQGKLGDSHEGINLYRHISDELERWASSQLNHKEPVNNTYVELFGGGNHNRFIVKNLNILNQGNRLFTLKGGRYSAQLDFYHDCKECGSAMNQIIVGIAGEEKAQACIWSGGKYSNGWKSARFSLDAPKMPGVYYIRVRYAQDYSCENALDWWKIDRPYGPTLESNIGFIHIQGD